MKFVLPSLSRIMMKQIPLKISINQAINQLSTFEQTYTQYHDNMYFDVTLDFMYLIGNKKDGQNITGLKRLVGKKFSHLVHFYGQNSLEVKFQSVKNLVTWQKFSHF